MNRKSPAKTNPSLQEKTSLKAVDCTTSQRSVVRSLNTRWQNRVEKNVDGADM